MNAQQVNSNSDLRKLLEQIWMSSLGLEATQDLHEGILLEQYYDNNYVATALKTTTGWEVTEGKAPKIPTMRIFYSRGACEELSKAENLDDFAKKLLDLIGVRSIVFIPMRSPEMLAKVGFGEFAERLGLPGK